MTLQEILHVKGSDVLTIDPLAKLDAAVQSLVHHNCGSLLVVERSLDQRSTRIVGIITERDILRACAKHLPLATTEVGEAMTRDVVTGTPTDSILDTMEVMTNRRVRHLPILRDGELAGLISIGDVVKARHEEAELENHYLKTYIQS